MLDSTLRFLRGPRVPRPNPPPRFALLAPEQETSACVHEWADGWARALSADEMLSAPDAMALGAALVAIASPSMNTAETTAWSAWRAGRDADDAWRDIPPTFGPPMRGVTGEERMRWSVAPPRALLTPLRALAKADAAARPAALATLLRLAVCAVPVSEGEGRFVLPRALAAMSMTLVGALDVARRGVPIAKALESGLIPPFFGPVPDRLEAPRGSSLSRKGDWASHATEDADLGPLFHPGTPARLCAAAALFDSAWGEALKAPARWASFSRAREGAYFGRASLYAIASVRFAPRLRPILGGMAPIDTSAERSAIARAAAELSFAWQVLTPFATDSDYGQLLDELHPLDEHPSREKSLRRFFSRTAAEALQALASFLSVNEAQGNPRTRAAGFLGLLEEPQGVSVDALRANPASRATALSSRH